MWTLNERPASVGLHYIGSTPAFIDAPGITGEAGSEKKVAYLQDGVPIVADANGVAQGSFTDRTKFLLGGGNNVLGRAIVLHSPVAGVKVAQGVIGLANPDASGSLSMLEYSDEVVSNDAGEAAMAQKINFASTMDVDKAGEPMVKV